MEDRRNEEAIPSAMSKEQWVGLEIGSILPIIDCGNDSAGPVFASEAN